MYERILVPLDGSKIAEAILPNVKDIVSKMSPEIQVEVTLLEVISGMTFNVLTRDRRAQVPLKEQELEKVKKESLEYLEKAASYLRSDAVKVKTMVTVGPIAEEIVNSAHEVKANIIAMSTHGFTGLRKWALGSITEEVLKTSDVPVLIIRAK